MAFVALGDLVKPQVERAGQISMNRTVYLEMKRLLALIDRIKGKDPREQVALIRAHVAATAQEAAAQSAPMR